MPYYTNEWSTRVEGGGGRTGNLAGLLVLLGTTADTWVRRDALGFNIRLVRKRQGARLMDQDESAREEIETAREIR